MRAQRTAVRSIFMYKAPLFKIFLKNNQEYAIIGSGMPAWALSITFEIPDHFHEVTEYWESIKEVADNFRFKDFLDEKLGYPTPVSFDDWLMLNHYQKLDRKQMN